MTILVTGATGNVGRHLVRDLLDARQHVRVLTRDAGRARSVLGDRAEIVATRLTDRAALDSAMTGVDRVFLACGNHPGQVEAECTVIDAAAPAGVQRLVKLSGPAPASDAKLLPERWHAQIEQHLAESGLPAVALRPYSFMSNLLAFAEVVATAGILPAPTDGARVAFVDPGDVGAVGAALLLRPEPLPAGPVQVTGPTAVSYGDVADALTAVTGRRVAFVPLDESGAADQMRTRGVPDAVVEVFLAVYRQQRQGAFARVTDAAPMYLHRPARPVTAFLTDHQHLYDPPGRELRPLTPLTASTRPTGPGELRTLR